MLRREPPPTKAEPGAARRRTGRGGRRGRVVLVLASLAVLLAAADTYVVVLALPDVMTGVGIGLDELQRATPIITAFLLGYVAVMPLIGRLADLHGRLPVLIGCLLVFAVGSLLTASADDLTMVVGGRALQGVGGGGLVPVTLALVADLWPEQRRGVPLGVVGAVQELGAVAGPLYGAVVLAVSGWRAIFWVNVVAAAVLALALLAMAAARGGHPPATHRLAAQTHGHSAKRSRSSGISALLAVAATCTGLLLLVAPDPLTSSVGLGTAYLPLVQDLTWTTPLGVATAALVLALLARRGVRALAHRLLREVDVPGAVLLSLALGTVVVAFAAADPSRQVVSDSGPVLLVMGALCAVLFAVRQRRADHPLVPRRTLAHRAAWGAMVVNLFVGAALVAALVDVPVFARATRFPDSQLGAALVLVQLLAALPVGALAGGWACRWVAPRGVAATGMVVAAVGLVAMAGWDEGSLDGPGSVVALVVTGLGFGLAVAPVNVALLAGTSAEVHGVASALGVVARTMGMLLGLSVLTAIGLRVFYAQQARIGTPLTLCPDSPGDCPAYELATRAALLDELSAVFWGAGACAAVAAVLALVLLRDTSGATGRSPR